MVKSLARSVRRAFPLKFIVVYLFAAILLIVLALDVGWISFTSNANLEQRSVQRHTFPCCQDNPSKSRSKSTSCVACSTGTQANHQPILLPPSTGYPLDCPSLSECYPNWTAQCSQCLDSYSQRRLEIVSESESIYFTSLSKISQYVDYNNCNKAVGCRIQGLDRACGCAIDHHDSFMCLQACLQSFPVTQTDSKCSICQLFGSKKAKRVPSLSQVTTQSNYVDSNNNKACPCFPFPAFTADSYGKVQQNFNNDCSQDCAIVQSKTKRSQCQSNQVRHGCESENLARCQHNHCHVTLPETNIFTCTSCTCSSSNTASSTCKSGFCHHSKCPCWQAQCQMVSCEQNTIEGTSCCSSGCDLSPEHCKQVISECCRKRHTYQAQNRYLPWKRRQQRDDRPSYDLDQGRYCQDDDCHRRHVQTASNQGRSSQDKINVVVIDTSAKSSGFFKDSSSQYKQVPSSNRQNTNSWSSKKRNKFEELIEWLEDFKENWSSPTKEPRSTLFRPHKQDSRRSKQTSQSPNTHSGSPYRSRRVSDQDEVDDDEDDDDDGQDEEEIDDFGDQDFPAVYQTRVKNLYAQNQKHFDRLVEDQDDCQQDWDAGFECGYRTQTSSQARKIYTEESYQERPPPPSSHLPRSVQKTKLYHTETEHRDSSAPSSTRGEQEASQYHAKESTRRKRKRNSTRMQRFAQTESNDDAHKSKGFLGWLDSLRQYDELPLSRNRSKRIDAGNMSENRNSQQVSPFAIPFFHSQMHYSKAPKKFDKREEIGASFDDTTRTSLNGHGIFAIVVFAIVSLIVIVPIRVKLPKKLATTYLKIRNNISDKIVGPPSDDLAPQTNSDSNEPVYLVIDHVTAPLLAVLLLLATKTIGGQEVRGGIVGEDGIEPYNVLLLFISLAYIAVSLDATGLLRYLAFLICLKAGRKGSEAKGMRIFLLLYGFFWLSGVFFGNDAVILFGTAFLVYFTQVAGIDPPDAWIWAEFVAANISSAVLVSSNLTNVVVATGFDIDFITYTAYMALPAMGSAIAALVVILVCFRDRPAKLAANRKGKNRFPSGKDERIQAKSKDEPVQHRTRQRRSMSVSSKQGFDTTTTSANLVSTNDDTSSDDSDETTKSRPIIYIPKTITRPDVDPKSALIDKTGAIFGSIVMLITLATLVGTSVLGTVKVFEISVPGAVLCLIRDAIADYRRWKHQNKSSSSIQPSDGNVIELESVPSPSPSPAPATAPAAATAAYPATKKTRIATLKAMFPTVWLVTSRLPLPLLPFAFGMFILVQALSHVGFINIMAKGLSHICARGYIDTAFFISGLGVILCNVGGTNVGSSILLTKAVRSSFFLSQLPDSSQRDLIIKTAQYSIAFSSNVGALAGTFSSSLAGLLWLGGLRVGGIHVRPLSFLIWCTLVILPATVSGVAILIAEIKYFHV